MSTPPIELPPSWELKKLPRGGGRDDWFIYIPSVFSIVDTIEKNEKEGKRSIEYKGNGRETWAHGSLGNYERTRAAFYDLQMPKNYIEGIKKLRDELMLSDRIKELAKKAINFRKKRKYDIGGSELDIDKLMTGNPEHWYDVTKTKENNVVKIHFNGGLLCNREEEDFFKLGSMLAVTAELLGMAGYAVEIYGYYQNRGQSNAKDIRDTIFIFPLKRAEEPIDIWRIASVALPGFFRSFMFTLFYSFIPDITFGLGRTGQPDDLNRQFEGIKTYFGTDAIDGDNVLVVEEVLKSSGII